MRVSHEFVILSLIQGNFSVSVSRIRYVSFGGRSKMLFYITGHTLKNAFYTLKNAFYITATINAPPPMGPLGGLIIYVLK